MTDAKTNVVQTIGLVARIPAPIITGGRYLLVILGSSVSTALGMKLISQADATALTSAITALPDALNALVKAAENVIGICTLISTLLMGAWGTWKSRTNGRISSLIADGSAKMVVVPTAEQAAKLPFQVISVDDTKKPDFVAATIENRVVTPAASMNLPEKVRK